MSVTYTPRYGRRNGGMQQSNQVTEGLSKFAASTQRQVSPGYLHISLFFFSFYAHRLGSSADFKGAAVTLSFSPVELTDRTPTRYFVSRHKFAPPVL